MKKSENTSKKFVVPKFDDDSTLNDIIGKTQALEEEKRQKEEQEKEQDNNKKDTKIDENMQKMSSNVEKSNTEQLINTLDEAIEKFEDFITDIESIDSFKRYIVLRQGIKYTITMPNPLSLGLYTLRNKKASFNYKTLTILQATKYCRDYLTDLRNYINYKLNKGDIIINNQQNYAELDGITITENEKLELLDKIINYCNELIHKFNDVEFLNYKLRRDIARVFGVYSNGLKRCKAYGFKHIKEKGYFSELTEKLIKINNKYFSEI